MLFELDAKLKDKLFVEFKVYETLYSVINNLQNLVIEYPEFVLPLIIQDDIKFDTKQKHIKENIVFTELIDNTKKIYVQVIFAKEFTISLNEFVSLIYYFYKEQEIANKDLENYAKTILLITNTDHKKINDLKIDLNKKLYTFNVKFLQLGYTII